MNGSPEKLRLYRKLSEISINSNCCVSSMYLIWVSKRFVENCAGCDYRWKDTYSNQRNRNQFIQFHWALTIRYILSLRLHFRCFYLLLASFMRFIKRASVFIVHRTLHRTAKHSLFWIWIDDDERKRLSLSLSSSLVWLRLRYACVCTRVYAKQRV